VLTVGSANSMIPKESGKSGREDLNLRPLGPELKVVLQQQNADHPPLQTSLHRPLDQAVNLIPAQPRLLVYRLLARLFQPLDGGNGGRCGQQQYSGPMPRAMPISRGSTSSSNFPTTPAAFQTTRLSRETTFVSKLNAAGSALVYSTLGQQLRFQQRHSSGRLRERLLQAGRRA
jgi:hypothetical protein